MSPVEPSTGSVAPWVPTERETRTAACPKCGEHNATAARYCQACAEPLGGLRLEQDARVVGVESAVVCEFFGPDQTQRAQEVLENAGGVLRELVESPNLVGATFGPEPVGGDGPLRAVLAAAELAGDLPDGKIGVGSGQVFEGDAEWRSTDRVIGLAIRLVALAASGEVILAEDLAALVGDVVHVEPVHPQTEDGADGPTGPVRLRGVAEPAFVLPELSAIALVGRDRERAELQGILDRAVAERSGRLVGIVGEAGVGKTALVEDSLRALEARSEVRVLRVRCRSALEPDATWPLAEIVERAAGIDEWNAVEDARNKIEALLGDPEDAASIAWAASVLALPDARTSPDETSRAFGRVLASVAQGAPLVLWIDDADAVDPTFWRLLRVVAASMKEIPLVALCAARELPDPVEESGDLDIARLEPLAARELRSLTEALLGGNELDEDVQRLVAQTSGGNPFVAEHLLAMLLEEGLVRWEDGCFGPTVDLSAPPTPPGAEAVLRARLDWLSPEEQIVVGLSATIGERVPVALLRELLPEGDRSSLSERLDALVGGRLIHLDSPDGEWLTFGHALVREAAERYVRDEARAEVLEHVGGWREANAGERGPRHGEVIASYLESALEIHARLGRTDPASRGLGERAATLLEDAAARAEQVGDERGAFRLLDRASLLVPGNFARRADLLFRSAVALAALGDHRADDVLAEVATMARATGARGSEWRAKVLLADRQLRTSSGLDALERAQTTVDMAIEAFEELDDGRGLAWAWSLRASIYLRWGNIARFAEAAELAVEHAGRAGMAREEIEGLRSLAWAILIGPLPVADAVARCEAIRERVRGTSPAEQEVEGVLAVLQARRGRFDEARELASAALVSLHELRMHEEAAVCLHRSGVVDALAGDLAASERAFRQVLELASSSGGQRTRAQAAASLAHVAVEQGNAEEALELAALSERAAASDDLPTQVEWRTARARAFAALGRFPEAESLARIAVRLAEQTDAAPVRGEALLSLALVRGLAGRANEALSLARRALRGFDRRGAEAQAAMARDVLDRFDVREARLEPITGPTPVIEEPVGLPEAPAEPDSGDVWARPS